MTTCSPVSHALTAGGLRSGDQAPEAVPGSEPIRFLDLQSMNAEVWPEISERWQTLFTSGEFIGGRAVEEFERSWAAYCGVRHAVGVGNGTDALVLSLRALGLKHDDEVIVPANTFVATAEAVVLAGASPRFADVCPDTLLLTPESVRAALTPRSRVLVVVQLYGQVADMDALAEVADEAGLFIVEDAAQAHGARWRDGRAGSFGLAGCFSFYPGKNLGAAGDAGAVVTDDDALADRLRVLRDHGRTGSHHAHIEVGTNSRLDALQAVVLSAKLRRLDAWNASRRQLMARYRENLDGSAARLLSVAAPVTPAHHLGVVRVPRRADVRAGLAERGIATGIHYPTPCHLSPAFTDYFDRPLPVAEAAAEEILSLPLSPHLSTADVDRVSEALLDLLHGLESKR
jgi:dTDP-4-amino-4,6-dideoxygalactose transaminase